MMRKDNEIGNLAGGRKKSKWKAGWGAQKKDIVKQRFPWAVLAWNIVSDRCGGIDLLR